MIRCCCQAVAAVLLCHVLDKPRSHLLTWPEKVVSDEELSNFDALLEQVVSSKSKHGSGGMQSKIDAAEILYKHQIETWIVNGLKDNFILNAFENTIPFTKIGRK